MVPPQSQGWHRRDTAQSSCTEQDLHSKHATPTAGKMNERQEGRPASCLTKASEHQTEKHSSPHKTSLSPKKWRLKKNWKAVRDIQNGKKVSWNIIYSCGSGRRWKRKFCLLIELKEHGRPACEGNFPLSSRPPVRLCSVAPPLLIQCTSQLLQEEPELCSIPERTLISHSSVLHPLNSNDSTKNDIRIHR